MLTTSNTYNGQLKAFWESVANISTWAKSLNDAMRAGLENMGYSGGLNTMLSEWTEHFYGTRNVHESLDDIKTVMRDESQTTMRGWIKVLKDETRTMTNLV